MAPGREDTVADWLGRSPCRAEVRVRGSPEGLLVMDLEQVLHSQCSKSSCQETRERRGRGTAQADSVWDERDWKAKDRMKLGRNSQRGWTLV